MGKGPLADGSTRRRTSALRSALYYTLFASILLLVLETFPGEGISPATKGGVLIALSGTFIFLLLRRHAAALTASEASIARLADYDPLTDLPNRTHFCERLEATLDYARRHGLEVEVTYLDFDSFRNVVRTFGLTAGHRLIEDIAARLKGCLEEGEFLAYVGGDEFTIMSAAVDQPTKAAGLASRLLEAISPPFACLGHELHLSASIGIALYPHDGDDAETLQKNAYAAMNRVKEMGGGHYQFYFPDLSEYSTAALILENRLRRALEEESFVLLYQPQLDLADGRVSGVEALVSWRHPAHPHLTPSEFIPLAEETGLIEPMGEWILRAACLQNRRWQDAGLPPVRVSVNVSARQFYRSNLVEMVKDALAESGLEPEWLDLEITETVLMQDMKETVRTLNGLKEAGVRVTIDDFGIGYSSLNYLKRFPVQTLKLDRSFVASIPDDNEDMAITAAVIAMSHAMNLEVVAEGVEREEQRAWLGAERCDKIQGFLVSRPLTADAFADFLRRSEEQRRNR